jgi:hypothetical protein
MPIKTHAIKTNIPVLGDKSIIPILLCAICAGASRPVLKVVTAVDDLKAKIIKLLDKILRGKPSRYFRAP